MVSLNSSNGGVTGVQRVISYAGVADDATPTKTPPLMAKPRRKGSKDELEVVSLMKADLRLRRLTMRSSYSENNLVAYEELARFCESVDDEIGRMRPEECLTPKSILEDEDFASASDSARSVSSDVSNSDSEEFMAEEEETVLLSRARQTVDFVDKQRTKLLSGSSRNRAKVCAWEALTCLLPKVVLPDGVNALDHALCVAEVCRQRAPLLEWLHLVGLVHNIGIINILKECGSSPHWTVAGESFPVGCKFSEDISFSHYFSSNPDRRKRVFNRPLGVYKQRCGLDHLRMSWGAPEYLYTVLRAATGQVAVAKLPREALFVVRYQKFWSLESSRHYHDFMNGEDREMLETLFLFQRIVSEVSDWAPTKITGVAARADMDHYKTLCTRHLSQILF